MKDPIPTRLVGKSLLKGAQPSIDGSGSIGAANGSKTATGPRARGSIKRIRKIKSDNCTWLLVSKKVSDMQ